MRVVFMGTPEFAVPSLKVVAQEHELLAVVTQPDRKQGRGQRVRFSPIKELALTYNVPIYQPERVATPEFVASLTELNPDIIVVVAFGQKIPTSILQLPPHGCINVHSSLLPKYRGAAPIQYAIINGETVTGVSTMYLNEGWDEGDIILQAEEPIHPEDTAGDLHDRLAEKGGQLLGETLRQIEVGTAPRIPQNHEEASFAPKLEKDDGLIDWHESAVKLCNLIRGMNPWPVAYFNYNGERIKVWQSKAVVASEKVASGKILRIDDQGIAVGTGDGILILQELQRQGSRRVSGRDFANGLRLEVGQSFGVE